MADAKVLFALLESAAGYALFEVVAFDEIGSLLDDNMDTVTDLSRFGRAVKLTAFCPFESAAVALENANAVSEHAMTGTLHNFLELNLPKISKKSKTAPFSLGIIDPGLATAIMEGLPGITCRSDDTIREIMRGCRLHLETFVKGLSNTGTGTGTDHHNASTKAQLGLGHSYSRSKVKFNPARSDNMIIQSIALLDQLDKDVNTFAMRVREWYSWHFPELKELVKDNVMFARSAAYIQDKATLFHSSADNDNDDTNDNDNDDDTGGEEKRNGDTNHKLAGLADIVGDTETAELIVAAAKTSMGMDCSATDMLNIVNFTQRMVKMAEYRKQLQLYLSEKMSVVAPNLSALIGDSVAARLISKVRVSSFRAVDVGGCACSMLLVLFLPFTNHSPFSCSVFHLPVFSANLDVHKYIVNKKGGFTDQLGQGASEYGPDSGRRKSAVSRAQDQGQHTKVRTDLPQHFYWPRRGQEQGPHFPLPGEQVLHCDPH